MAEDATSPRSAHLAAVTPMDLRARQRDARRSALVAVAFELFAERGFDQVTVADVCAAADVAPRTFFRYFAGKDDVIGEPARVMSARVTASIDEAPQGSDTWSVLCEALADLGLWSLDNLDQLRTYTDVARRSAHLRSADLTVRPTYETQLADQLAAHCTDSYEDAWERRLAVALAAAAFRVWLERLLDGGTDPDRPLAWLTAALDRVRDAQAGPRGNYDERRRRR